MFTPHTHNKVAGQQSTQGSDEDITQQALNERRKEEWQHTCLAEANPAQGWWKERRRQAESHREKICSDDVDGVLILGPAKRSSKLQVTTHFLNDTSKTS